MEGTSSGEGSSSGAADESSGGGTSGGEDDGCRAGDMLVAPQPVQLAGGLAVPIDVQALEGELVFDVATATTAASNGSALPGVTVVMLSDGSTRVPADIAVSSTKLVELRVEHRDLDEAIERLTQVPPEDDLMLRRLKKRKLMIKDRISALERMLDPDEYA